MAEIHLAAANRLFNQTEPDLRSVLFQYFRLHGTLVKEADIKMAQRILIPPYGGSNLDIANGLSSQEAYFLANLWGFLVSCSKPFAAETVSCALSAAAVMKISPAPLEKLEGLTTATFR